MFNWQTCKNGHDRLIHGQEYTIYRNGKPRRAMRCLECRRQTQIRHYAAQRAAAGKEYRPYTERWRNSQNVEQTGKGE